MVAYSAFWLVEKKVSKTVDCSVQNWVEYLVALLAQKKAVK
jgi:hypothetical protein